ncbi:MAG TPA: (d)CMP kinase [Blastocatellia bacterium]|nr:(d)CMP kinase [Blastocatellia bacterium]
MKRLIIAIDGPSGVGKSTLGKELARRLGYLYIDSGAVYRALGRKAIDNGVALDDRESLARIARESDVRLEGDPDHLRTFLDGREVTREIRAPDASHAASVVATIPEVREAVVEKLRLMGAGGGVVMDGRDIGTKVFPEAQVKLFLEADLDVRARRRWNEERGRGREASIEQISSELEERDRRDRGRAATPLIRADDAILLDTSDLDLDRVVGRVLEIVEMRS